MLACMPEAACDPEVSNPLRAKQPLQGACGPTILAAGLGNAPPPRSPACCPACLPRLPCTPQLLSGSGLACRCFNDFLKSCDASSMRPSYASGGGGTLEPAVTLRPQKDAGHGKRWRLHGMPTRPSGAGPRSDRGRDRGRRVRRETRARSARPPPHAACGSSPAGLRRAAVQSGGLRWRASVCCSRTRPISSSSAAGWRNSLLRIRAMTSRSDECLGV